MPFPYCWNIGDNVGFGSDCASLESTSRDILIIEGEGHEREDRTWVMARGSEGRERVRDGVVVRYDIKR